MLKCTRCGAELKITKRKAKLCLACKRAYDASWRARRKSEGRPVRIKPKPRSREYEVAYEAKYYQRADVKARRAKNMRDYTKRPDLRPRHEARWRARRAIKSGRLKPLPCEICGANEVHAHHDDYSRPLDVRWLCPTHHREHHAAQTET